MAALFDEDAKNVAIAAPLFRIRPDTSCVIPEYLWWWINQSSSQSYLHSRSKGTLVKMVSKQSLEQLQVALPSLAQQRKIIDVFELYLQEKKLSDKIRDLRKSLVDNALIRMTIPAESSEKLMGNPNE